jgi:transcription antitermination factor NusG
MFKVGDEVRVIESDHDSVNNVGDVGTITEVDDEMDKNGLQYRVQVTGKPTYANWHTRKELEIIK